MERKQNKPTNGNKNKKNDKVGLYTQSVTTFLHVICSWSLNNN